MKSTVGLKEFLLAYDEEVASLAMELRKYILQLVPEANELIWDNYNALAMAFSKSEKLKDAFCHLAVYSGHVNFGFNRGAELSSTLPLNGSGKLIRHVKVTSINTFPKEEIQSLIFQALGLSEKLNPELIGKTDKGKSIVMSISANKRRPK